MLHRVRVPLAVLVGHDAPQRVEDALGREILRRDEHERVALAHLLHLDDVVELLVRLDEGLVQRRALRKASVFASATSCARGDGFAGFSRR